MGVEEDVTANPPGTRGIKRSGTERRSIVISVYILTPWFALCFYLILRNNVYVKSVLHSNNFLVV